MKKLLLTASLAVLTTSAMAEIGTLKFTGESVANTCSVDNGDLNQTVELPTLSAADLKKDIGGGATPFEIKITNCDAALNTADVRFSGANARTFAGNMLQLVNTATTNPSKADVLFYGQDINENNVDFYKGVDSLIVKRPIVNGAVTYPLIAAYVVENASSVTEADLVGNVTSSVDVEVRYR